MGGRRSQTWTEHFDSPPEAIWPVMADTARYNEAAGLPKHEIEEIPWPDRSVRYIGRARMGPFALEWDDGPVNWVTGQWFRHHRQFSRGPLKFLCATFRLHGDGEGSRGEYTVEAEPATLLGRLILATGFFPGAERTFRRMAANARDFAGGRRETEFEFKPPRLPPEAAERAAAAVARIEATAHGHGLARRLADWVLTRQEVDVWSIRPLRLARHWGVPERHIVEACLEAVKQGLLRLRWDLLCPRCQVGKLSVSGLDQLPTGAHCATCNIDYGRDYTKNLEAAFHPAKAVRPLESGDYCLYGPMSTPHVLVQRTVEPGETVDEALTPPRGVYQFRTLEPIGDSLVHWEGDRGFPEAVAEDDTVTAGPPSPHGQVRLRNRTDRRLTFVIEERQWARDALTAHRVTTLQAFRDLFNDDVLRPGDDVEIDNVTLMFTDLLGSTSLYETIGDAPAYVLVRQHYAVIGKAIRETDGSIVKTIGDAVMGAFCDPADAFRCAVRLHADFAAYNAQSGREPVVIRVGLHRGRCISVTLNNRLNYYGTAPNLAARLEVQGKGGDVVLSREVATDAAAAVAALLADYSPIEEESKLKGFHRPVAFLRITPEDLAARRGAAEEDSAGASV